MDAISSVGNTFLPRGQFGPSTANAHSVHVLPVEHDMARLKRAFDEAEGDTSGAYERTEDFGGARKSTTFTHQESGETVTLTRYNDHVTHGYQEHVTAQDGSWRDTDIHEDTSSSNTIETYQESDGHGTAENDRVMKQTTTLDYDMHLTGAEEDQQFPNGDWTDDVSDFISGHTWHTQGNGGDHGVW